MKKINVFVDGSCINNPGPGGYCIILKYKKYKRIISAGYLFTTNNRMELMAAVQAIELIQKFYLIKIHTDSKYLCEGITKWIKIWKNRNWKTFNRKSVKNIDLWKRLDNATKNHILEWKWIKGHSGHPENEQCDKLARIAACYPTLNDFGYK
ncbi:MAG: ribonuclease HI [Enterobacteriaceae bacterium]